MNANNFHKLTNEIKDYFANDKDNDFVKKISALLKIEDVGASPEEDDNYRIIISFEEKPKSVASILFADGYATLWYKFEDFFIEIHFYYDALKKTVKKSPYIKCTDLISDYSNYGIKGMSKLFDDIYKLAENIINKKVFIEYIENSKSKYKELHKKFTLEKLAQVAENDEQRERLQKGMEEFYEMSEKAYKVVRTCRICLSPNQTIAHSKKWKDRCSRSEKLKTIYL